MRTLYADHIHGTPVLPEVEQAMSKYWSQEYGHPGCLHRMGQHARQAIETARRQVAHLIDASPQEVVFTSTVTEANNLAIKGVIGTRRHLACHIITSSVEHPSVLHVCHVLEQRGIDVTYLAVDAHGCVHPDAVARVIRPETALISLQYANAEIGSIQPVIEVGRIARDHRIVFHVDASMVAGLMPMHMELLRPDLLTLSAQTLYGPKGAAALYVRHGVAIQPQMQGDRQEGGLRPGVVNTPAVVGMGVAAEMSLGQQDSRAQSLRALGQQLSRGLLELLPSAKLTGHPTHRLPGHVSCVIDGVDGDSLVLQLSAEDICAASGLWNEPFSRKTSHVLSAIGVDRSGFAGEFIVSFGLGNTPDEVDRLLHTVVRIVRDTRMAVPRP